MAKEFVVAIELGSSKVTGIAGEKKPDGSISVLAVVCEPSSAFIHKGVVYNIDKTAQCLNNIVKRLETQLHTRITQVFVGVGGQSIRGVRNTVVRDYSEETKITAERVAEMMDENRGTDYPERTLIDVAEQEYRINQQLQLDPVGVQATRLEGNYLNIVQRRLFNSKLTDCFEQAGIAIADFFLGPRVLAEAVLTEAERRSGCALVDIGADTTTVSVYYKNVLRHLVVIPLGSANVTKDIASLQMEEADAERMKLKYGSAYTDSTEADPDKKYTIDQGRSVEADRFNEIVEGRVLEIVENVWCQIQPEYGDKLLGGIVLTGGGAQMRNMERAFQEHTRVEKIRTAKTILQTVNSSHETIKAQNGTMNTVLGLLARANANCAGTDISREPSIFDEAPAKPTGPDAADRTPRTPAGKEPGVVSTQREQDAARKKREEEEKKQKEEEEKRQEEERKQREANSFWGRVKRGLTKLGNDIVSEEE